MIVKPVATTNPTTRFAWLPGHKLFVAAPDEAELLNALSILEIAKAD